MAIENEDLENEEQEDSMRDSLSDAFDAEVSEETAEAPAAEEAAAPKEEAEPKEPATEATAPKEGEPAAEDVNAPASWSPAAREEWANVPKSVQDTISKREKEITTAMQESSNARQQMASFGEMVKPFQGMFASQGVQNPMQGVYNVLQTTAQLQNGTPQNKAAALAGLVRQFDVGIKDLDDALVGNVQAEQKAPSDPRYDALEQRYNQLEQRFQGQDNEAQAQINSETQAFLKDTPFANDVRGVMADFMDLAHKSGEKLSLKDAYARAVATRPDIQQIIANREKAEAGAKHLGKSRAAGVVVPINSEGGVAPAPSTLRGALDAAWDQG